jgi:enediyne biosynthesis protein E4
VFTVVGRPAIIGETAGGPSPGYGRIWWEILMRRLWLGPTLAAATALVLGAVWWGLKARTQRQYLAAIVEGKAAANAGKLAKARQALERAAALRPEVGEAQYLLGAVEKATGRPDAARLAWLAVPPESEFALHAAMMLARGALVHDRHADAEPYLKAALGASMPTGKEAREVLLNLFKVQNRLEEARRLVRDGWETYPDRIGTLQQLWRLDTASPVLLEDLRYVVENAAKHAPDDDRVWLAQGNLAGRTSRYGEAAEFLKKCESRRPDDPAVWRARLDLALATQDVAGSRRALDHLPDDALPADDLVAVRAWFAARAGDLKSERRALEQLVAVAPGRLAALDRLAGLAKQAGEEAEATRLRGRKAELDKILERYRERLFKPEPAAAALELAGHAESLGRLFEARAWWELAVARDGALKARQREALDRLARAEAARRSAATLAGLLADLGRATGPTQTPPAVASTGPTPAFVDDAEAVGLRFRYDAGASKERQIPETMGTGLGLLDFDGDGWLDVYATQGCPFPPDPKRPANGDRLFHNRGDGSFEDATLSSGIAAFPGGYGHGVAVGDVDNDGDPDLFVMRWRSYALYRNRGDGTFEDATASAGLGGDRDWPTSAAFADLDGDGDLDLYVAHYLVWDQGSPFICHDPKFGANRLCNPGLFPSLPDHVFRNDGGRFVEVTREAGIVDTHGRGMGVVAADVDDDGRVDLYVANDQSANFLWRNLGGFRFEEVGHSAGVAASGSGGYRAGMGVDCGDVDGDGLPDLVVTNFYDEGTGLFQNLGQGVFNDRGEAFGLTTATRSRLGFGIAFLDANNDGRLDLVQANGHVDDFRPESPYAMPLQLFLGGTDGRLTDFGDRAGPPFRTERLGRALAVGDLDNDGRLDLLMACLDAPLMYAHNRTDRGHHLTLRLEGTTSNRDAVGARVTVTAAGRARVAWRKGGGSYQAAGDPRIHFGLGDADRVESVEVRWPSGRVDRVGPLAADDGYLIREGTRQAERLRGFQSGRKAAEVPSRP